MAETPFIVRNESFKCQHCGLQNAPLKGSCRNHCVKCLFSLHVDLKGPGDRANPCQSLMKPVGIEHSGKKGYIILHKCQKCRQITKNKAAADDNFDQIIKLSRTH